jgi:hypothetical protein
MINYELALQLKNAGFPQLYKQTNPWMDFAYHNERNSYSTKDNFVLHMLHYDNDTGWWIGNDYGDTTSDIQYDAMLKDWVKCPTLSELIEACGDGFNGLLKKENSLWEAGITGGALGYCYVDDNSSSIFGTGSTPEEAVANLYLAINSK